MTDRRADGRVESLLQRLRNEFQSRGEDVGLGLQRYAIERFLYRLGRSDHRKQFVLKGATLFAMWGTAYRPTRDIDFTGYGSSDPKDVVDAVREICETRDDVEQVVFDTANIRVEPIRDGSEYDGLRVKIVARIGRTRIPVQMDVGFGNAIVPGPQDEEYRTILGDPPPRILAYPAESVVSEKLHAMVILGERNSRMKDFYDIHSLAREFRFERSTLVSAAKATFERRGTPLEAGIPAALTAAFYADVTRADLWRAYVTRNKLERVSPDYDAVGEVVIGFLRPVWDGIGTEGEHSGTWEPGGPWQSIGAVPI